MNLFSAAFQPTQPIPESYKSNFKHLYWDVVWFGILNGSAISFIAIYAARLGANTTQLGLLNAAPAIINLAFALPAGRWIERKARGKPVFWSAILQRFFYVLLSLLPLFFGNSTQVMLIIGITLVMNIPGTALTIGFNTIFADAVPTEWRAYVSGIRNAIVSVTTIISSLACGQILVRVHFPVGYQIVFAIGFLGGLLSSYHLWFLKPVLSVSRDIEFNSHAIKEFNPDEENSGGHLLAGFGLGKISNARWFQSMRGDIVKGYYGKVLVLLFGCHFSQYIGIPLFSIYMVNRLHLSDQTISFGSALGNAFTFLGSLQVARLSRRWGTRKLTGVGVILMTGYPALLMLAKDATLYMVACVFSGIAWSLVGAVLYNYLLECVPEGDRPAHMAWYNLVLNAAILTGSMIGPLVANQIGISNALLVTAVTRLLAGLAVLKWG
jgi:MFS family permease